MGRLNICSQPCIAGAKPGCFCRTGSGTRCDGLPLGGTGLAPGQTANWMWIFNPHAMGTRTAQLIIQTDAAGSPQIFTFIGNGIPAGNGGFSLGAANGVTTSTISAGQTATYNLIALPTGLSGTVTVNMSCTGAPAGSV